MTPEQAMTARLEYMDKAELQWVMAYCEMKCKEAGTNVEAMKKYDERLERARMEMERRKA